MSSPDSPVPVSLNCEEAQTEENHAPLRPASAGAAWAPSQLFALRGFARRSPPKTRVLKKRSFVRVARMGLPLIRRTTRTTTKKIRMTSGGNTD
uniref:Uncharacterized protein n=1 Tax=Steinernema glaseri TaxID=37863 RepID=A0A1I8AAX4_9BILA